MNIFSFSEILDKIDRAGDDVDITLLTDVKVFGNVGTKTILKGSLEQDFYLSGANENIYSDDVMNQSVSEVLAYLVMEYVLNFFLSDFLKNLILYDKLSFSFNPNLNVDINSINNVNEIFRIVEVCDDCGGVCSIFITSKQIYGTTYICTGSIEDRSAFG